MVCAEDVETQRKGVVGILWTLGPTGKVSIPIQNLAKQVELSKALPLRIAALHFCHDNYVVQPILLGLKLFLDTFTRVRLRSHYGT
jgi:hypothetical protein